MRLFVRLLLPGLLGLILVVGCSTTSNSATGGDIQPQPQAMGGSVAMRILWTVSAYRLGTNAVWGDEEARKLLFKPLDMDANSITFDGQKCLNVIFQKKQ
jgi:hypothetical protein